MLWGLIIRAISFRHSDRYGHQVRPTTYVYIHCGQFSVPPHNFCCHEYRCFNTLSDAMINVHKWIQANTLALNFEYSVNQISCLCLLLEKSITNFFGGLLSTIISLGNHTSKAIQIRYQKEWGTKCYEYILKAWLFYWYFCFQMYI